MKKLNYLLSYIAILALLFTSCSKEETAADPNVQETFQIQFGTLLNDFNKQQQDPEECQEDVDPDYVLVALTDASDAWVAGKNPEAPGADVNDFIKINIKNNNGSWETEYSDELGLPAGTYQLQYFIVYSADDQVLWVAPREGGAYASSVGDPLPQEIVLGAGTKPYIEVDVLCFNPRSEDAFGYIFFDINLIEVTNNYCIFVNFCDDGTGREYPAMFEVDVWADGYDGSDIIVDGEMNSVSGVGNDFAATVLCFPLPPLEGDDAYFVRVTALTAGAYVADASDFFEFEISQADIDAQLLEVPAYRHIRINCGDDNGNGECDLEDPLQDCDNDGVLNGDDECPTEAGPAENDGCPEQACDLEDPLQDCDNDGVLNGDDECPSEAGPAENNGCPEQACDLEDPNQDCDDDGVLNGVDECPTIPGTVENNGCPEDPCAIEAPDTACAVAFFEGNESFTEIVQPGETPTSYVLLDGQEFIGNVTITISESGDPVVIINSGIDFSLDDYRIEVSQNADGSNSTCVAQNNISPADPDVFEEFDQTANYVYPFYVKIVANYCPLN